jgi:cytochrome c
MSYSTLMTRLVIAGLMATSSGQAFAEGDAVKGERVFRKCSACHSVKDTSNRVGPHLVGIVGRPIASVAEFRYSEDLKTYATTAMTWDEEKLSAYFENPRGLVAKTSMVFVGLKNEVERQDVIAYLKTIQ